MGRLILKEGILVFRKQTLNYIWTIMKALDFLVAFIGGAVVGAACGMLFAPEKGSDLREKIAEALRKRGIKLNRKEMSDLVDEIAEELQANKEEEWTTLRIFSRSGQKPRTT